MQILNRQQHVAPTPPSQRVEGVDKALEAIVLKALEKDRDARFRDLRELRAALKSLLGGASTGHMRRVEVPDLSPSERRVKAAAPVVASGLDEPDWLERSGSWNHSSSTKSGHSSVPPPASSPLAAALVADPARVLARIAQTTDARTFRSIAGQLEAAIHELASAGDGGALWKLTSTLDVIATEPTQGPTTRAATAAVLLRVTYDPQVLAPIAESVLASAQNATDLGWRLLVRAGLGGAYAAYSARVKNPSPDARRRFVLVLHEIGIPALPVMRAGLERVEPRLATAGATELAEDLLAALPPVADEATGNVVARYVRMPAASLACAATRSLPRLWGKRARALLLALAQHPDDDVKVAAVSGLAELHAVDTHVVKRLESIVDGSAGAGRELRLGAIVAFAKADGEAQPHAANALARAMQPGAATDDYVLPLAKALVATAGEAGHAVIRARVATAPERVRTLIDGILRP
jgi:serine/threonine-protein kinase